MFIYHDRQEITKRRNKKNPALYITPPVNNIVPRDEAIFLYKVLFLFCIF